MVDAASGCAQQRVKQIGIPEMKPLRMRDDAGQWVTHGDWIEFSYGIPPVAVRAKVEKFEIWDSCWNESLVVICPAEHKPRIAFLRTLRRHVGEWWKVEETK